MADINSTTFEVTLDANVIISPLNDLQDVDVSTSNNGEVLALVDGVWTGITVSGTGDMAQAVYDPTSVGADAFDMDNMVEGTSNKILTSAERNALTVIDVSGLGDKYLSDDGTYKAVSGSGDVASVNGYTGVVTLDADDLAEGTNLFLTAAERSAISANTAKVSFDSTSSTRLANTSGTNTGDQDLSGLQDEITLTTTGTSGAATLVGATLNIPQYEGTAYTLPTATDTVLGGVKIDGSTITISNGVISAATGGSGDVTGPVSAVDENIAVFNSTSGKIIEDSGINKTAITANTAKISYTDAAKVAGIEAGATANSTDATLLDRANHTGSQAISTVTSLQTELDTKVEGPGLSTEDNLAVFNGASGKNIKDSAIPKTDLFRLSLNDLDDVPNGSTYVRSENNFTDAEVTKLSNISVTQAVDLDTMESDISTNSTNISSKIEGDSVAKITVGVTEPSSPSTGDLWIDVS